MAITSFEIFPSFSHPVVRSIRKGCYTGSWVRTTQLAHDPLDVTLDLIVCGDQHIETILLDDFEVFCRIYPPLVENATTQMSVGELKTPWHERHGCLGLESLPVYAILCTRV